MHPQARAQLQTLPGLVIDDNGLTTNIEVPIHGWLVIKPYLDQYFRQHSFHRKFESLGPPKRRYEGVPTRRFPASLDPSRLPGLNAVALQQQRPCQVDSWRRLFLQGCALEEIPAGGGKTFIALGAACAAASLGWKVLIIGPTSARQWDAEIERWIEPGAIPGFTVLQGQIGCEVRVYKAKTAEVVLALVSREEAKARLPARTRLGPLEVLWDENGDPISTPTLASEVSSAAKKRGVDLGFLAASTKQIHPARWVVYDHDAQKPIKVFEDGYAALTIDAHGPRTLGPAEAAEAFILPLNRKLRCASQILVASAGILTTRRDALRDWAPDLVIIDESHTCKDFHSPWKRIPPANPGDKPIYILQDTQAASAWWVCQNASAVLLLSATPDPDRRRDLFAQYELCDPRGWGKFVEWSKRYAAGRNREVPGGNIIWDSTGEIKRGVPIPIDPSLENELRLRAGYIHHITPRAVSHASVPPINRQLIWLKGTELSRPGKDPEWEVPVRSARDVTNRLLDMAAEMKRKPAVAALVPRVLAGQKGIVLTGSHASCDRLEAEFRKKLCGKEYILTQRNCALLREVWAAALAPSEKPPVVTPGSVVYPLVLCAHGGTGDRYDRYETLTRLLLHPGPAILVGTVDAWGQGWDRMQFLDFAAILRLPWNQGKVLQAEGRFERLRGLYSVLVEYYLASGTIDERLLRTVLGKADASLRLFNRDDLTRLRSGLAEEESEDSILSNMLAGLLGKNGQPAIDLPADEDADDFEIDALVNDALDRGNDRELI